MFKLSITKTIERTPEELEQLVKLRPDIERYGFNPPNYEQYKIQNKYKETCLEIELTEEQYNTIKKSALEVF